jgi:hypothetical protein
MGRSSYKKHIPSHLHHVEVMSELKKFSNSTHQRADKRKYICCRNLQIKQTFESAINAKTVVIFYCFLLKNQAVHILTEFDLSLNVNMLMISYSYSKLQYIIMSQSLFLMQDTHYKFLPKLT